MRIREKLVDSHASLSRRIFAAGMKRRVIRPYTTAEVGRI
jgi:hypothetical protein